MRNKLHMLCCKLFIASICLSVGCGLFTSCKDDYIFDDEYPNWLGASIYDYLVQAGEFTTYVRMIDALDYTEILAKTGSKTLFVANDEAFQRFYTQNEWGVTRFEDFTKEQMNLIINSSMINNAYLMEMLSNTEGPVKGQAMRRQTSVPVFVEKTKDIPATPYWNNYHNDGLVLAKDGTPIPMVHFLQAQMASRKITNDDFKIIFNGQTREDGDAHIYGIKVVKRDITCQNGYIHQIEDVLIPPGNMAEVIRKAPEVKTFNTLLERFSAPYYSASLTEQYFYQTGNTDSVFIKSYFAKRSASGERLTPLDPANKPVAGYLDFDPGWNSYVTSSNSMLEADMGVMFVPTDEVINDYFINGGGRFLYDRYGGSWENIPDEVLDDLINNHMKPSFVNSVPSKFAEIMNDARDPMGVEPADVVKSYIANNGVVYVTNRIYPPASYVAVSAPALVSENMRIFNWAIKELQYDAYLLSMDSYYSFIIPNDEALKVYVDPVSFGKTQPEVFEFHFDTEYNRVAALIRAYNPETKEVGEVLRTAGISEIRDRLDDLLDYHIVVGDIEDGKEFYRTKMGGTIRISKENSQLVLQGGMQVKEDTKAHVIDIYDQTGEGNGKAYIVDAPLQASVNSVYSIFNTEPYKSKFSKFFELLEGNPEATDEEHELYDIFYRDKSYVGIDYNVKFFNTYHYTIYVPTDEAVNKAIAAGLPTWEDINREGNADEKKRMTEQLVSFLRYHFQDNSVYIDGTPIERRTYETAALNESSKRFYTLEVEGNGNNLMVKDNAGNVRNVSSDKTFYNVMARDYKFNSNDPANATQIETSSFAVIHLIDDALYYEKDQFKANPAQ